MSHRKDDVVQVGEVERNSLMSGGRRLSVHLPRRMVPISAGEPIGFARPLRIARTRQVVVLTAPRPTNRMPSLPLAGAISTGVGTKKNYIIIG